MADDSSFQLPATTDPWPHPANVPSPFHGRREMDLSRRIPAGRTAATYVPVHVQMGNSTVAAPGDSHSGRRARCRAPALVGLMGGLDLYFMFVCITDDISHQGKRKLSQPLLVFRISCVPSFFFLNLCHQTICIISPQDKGGKKSMFGMIFRVWYFTLSS